jgi:hypothetical protein
MEEGEAYFSPISFLIFSSKPLPTSFDSVVENRIGDGALPVNHVAGPICLTFTQPFILTSLCNSLYFILRIVWRHKDSNNSITAQKF